MFMLWEGNRLKPIFKFIIIGLTLILLLITCSCAAVNLKLANVEDVSKIEANSQGIKITLGQKILNKVGNIAGAVTKEEASLKASLDAAKAKSPVFQTVSNNEKGGAITSILNKLSHTQPSNNNVNGINSVSNGRVPSPQRSRKCQSRLKNTN